MENFKEAVNIAMICDDNYIIPTSVAIKSIINSNFELDKINFYIIAVDISEENMDYFNLYKNNLIDIIIVNASANEFIGIHKWQEKSHCVANESALLKFKLPELLSHLDKVLYLDGDIIVSRSLSEVYNTNLKNNYAAVVQDSGVLYNNSSYLKNFNKYFNSGFMLLNLKKMRVDNITDKLIKTKQSNFDNSLMDQNVFNKVFNNRIILLPLIYNFLYINLCRAKDKYSISELNKLFSTNFKTLEDVLENAVVIHFSSKDKPWKFRDVPLADLWYSVFLQSSCRQKVLLRGYLDDTKYSGENLEIEIIDNGISYKNKNIIEYKSKDKKNNDIKVSVILPIYNVEAYLYESLNSIINQTLKEIEIICINDGSTDNSLSILKKYAKKDKRIIIIDQENQGAGVARNAGLKIAKGEYLSFLDPDDFFELTLLEDCYNKSIETDVDILVYLSKSFNNKTNIYSDKVAGLNNGIRLENLPNNRIFDHNDMPDKIFDTFQSVAWNKFFKTTFIKENNLSFQNLFRTNDVYFVSISLALAKKITVLEKVLVYYRVGMTTNSQATNYMYPLNFYQAFYKVKEKLKDLNYYDLLKNSLAIKVLHSTIYNLRSQKMYEGFKIVYEHIVNNFESDFNISEFEELIYLDDCVKIEFYEDYLIMLENSVDEYLELKEKRFINKNDTSLKISVIIPLYNVEKYLSDCLDSVINQTLENIEIICINDGSTDNSIEILREYSEKDDRIIVLNQQNQGQSVARNKGIEIAQGQYIYFLDSDDMIVPYALERMYEEVFTNNLDVLYFDGNSIFENSQLESNYNRYKTLYQSNFSTNLVLSGAKMFSKMNLENSHRVSPCLFLIKKEFLVNENILFFNGIIHEDNIFMFKTILIARRVKHIKEELFIRRVRQNSTITQKTTFNHFYGYFVCYKEMLDYANKFNYTEDVEKAVVISLERMVNGAVRKYSVLSKEEKNKINTLTKLERHSFESLIQPKVQALSYTNDMKELKNNLNWNRNQLAKSSKSNKGSVSNSYVNKINGQLRWARGELKKVRGDRLALRKEVAQLRGVKSTFSYQLGRFITWLPRKIRDIFIG